MGGQDGYATDLTTFDTKNGIFTAGITAKASDSFTIGFDFAYVDSAASMQQYDLSAPEYVAITPTMTYDFSDSHLNSDLDYKRLDWDLFAKYSFSEAFWMYLRYRISDFDDNAPYMYDTSGQVQWITAALGWSF